MDGIDGIGPNPSNPSQSQSNPSIYFVFFSTNLGKNSSKMLDLRIEYFLLMSKHLGGMVTKVA